MPRRARGMASITHARTHAKRPRLCCCAPSPFEKSAGSRRTNTTMERRKPTTSEGTRRMVATTHTPHMHSHSHSCAREGSGAVVGHILLNRAADGGGVVCVCQPV